MDTANTLRPTVGHDFAGFRIIRVLGAGGMGTVYLAAHPRLPRENALKILPAELSVDPVYRARFEREAELAADLAHPHIVRIHDRGEYHGQFWLSMDYIAGTDVARLLRDNYPGGMPLDQVMPIITAVGSALDYAHERGLLHRDVKPANILLTAGDGEPQRVYLADFGIARRMDDSAGLTATNFAVGTANYAAPEQLKGEYVDGRADQYALACTAFHLLTGAPPYNNSNPAVVIAQHVSAPPPSIGTLRPHLAGLDWVFAVAMAKEPSRRFASCREFTEQLAQQPNFAYAGEISGGAATWNYPQTGVSITSPRLPRPAAVTDKKRRRRPVAIVGALLCAILLMAGGVFASMKLLSRLHSTGATTATAPASEIKPTTPPPNTGPFTGFYQVEFSVVAGLDGQPAPIALTPTTETWEVRSVCGAAGCVATASRVAGTTAQVPTMVLDEVDGNWIAVSVGSSTCDDVEGEVWESFTLQRRPDGILAGEVIQTMSKGCSNKRSVTFTRTGDVDVNKLPDPAALPPRVSSPAAAMHGSYHQTSRQPNGFKEQRDFAAQTDCLRTGARCVTLFHTAPATVMVLVYQDESWLYEREFDARCWKGGMAHVKIVVPFALPQPAQDPITLLSGHGHEEITGTSCPGTDVDVSFARTGD